MNFFTEPGRKKHTLVGYTLIEIMLVLSIIAILLGAGIYYLAGNVDVAKATRAEADMKTISVQLKAYEILNRTMPTTDQGLKALVEKPATEPMPKAWRQLLKEEALYDPWSTKYNYTNPGTHNTGEYDLWSSGPDKISGTEDDITNW